MSSAGRVHWRPVREFSSWKGGQQHEPGGVRPPIAEEAENFLRGPNICPLPGLSRGEQRVREGGTAQAQVKGGENHDSNVFCKRDQKGVVHSM